MSKPTMQDIADKLFTSRISVWRALNSHPGVSDELRQKVYETAENIGFFKKENMVTLKSSETKTVSAVVARPESSSFWMQIIHQMAKELGNHNVNLMYTYLPSNYKDGYSLPDTLTNGSVSGAIMLNTYSEPILKMLAGLNIPKVFLDTVPTMPFEKLNGDLVLIEGRQLVQKITTQLLAMGYTKLGFIGDIDYAQTNTDRYNGFIDAHKLTNVDYYPKFCMTKELGLKTHYEEISTFLRGLSTLPDAFVCPSDYIAHFIQQYFTENSIPNHNKILLTGFDNNTEYANVANKITTVDVQTKSLGARLANKILFSINNPDASCEVSYVTSEILYKEPLFN